MGTILPEDPGGPRAFIQRFFSSSRLHFIGSWRQRYASILHSLPGERSPALPRPLVHRGKRVRVLLHVDMDAFFASVALLTRPHLREKPVCVCWAKGGKSTSASEISSANYIARKSGIHAGQWLGEARKRCPELVTVPFDFDAYVRAAEAMYRCLFTVSRHVEGVSCDEAFVEVTQHCTVGASDSDVYNHLLSLAARLRASIQEATGGCCASIGIGTSRMLARVATKLAKPNRRVQSAQGDGGEVILGWPANQEDFQRFWNALEVRSLPGVGRKSLPKIRRALPPGDLGDDDVLTCGDVRRACSIGVLKRALGNEFGTKLHDMVRGLDTKPWEPHKRERPKTVQAQISWGVRFSKYCELEEFIQELSIVLASRLKHGEDDFLAGGIGLKIWRAMEGADIKYQKGFAGHGMCDHLTRTLTLPRAVDDGPGIATAALQLFAALKIQPSEVRGVGISATKLCTASEVALGKRAGMGSFVQRISPARQRTRFDIENPPWRLGEGNSATHTKATRSQPVTVDAVLQDLTAILHEIVQKTLIVEGVPDNDHFSHRVSIATVMLGRIGDELVRLGRAILEAATIELGASGELRRLETSELQRLCTGARWALPDNTMHDPCRELPEEGVLRPLFEYWQYVVDLAESELHCEWRLVHNSDPDAAV